MRFSTTALLVAGSIGLTFAGSSSAFAVCGTYGGYDPAAAPENVIVNAPRVKVEPGRLNTPIQRVSLSATVQYADLNLCTAEGVQALRVRVRIAANNVCKQIEGMYPHANWGDPSCYQEANSNAMARVDNAVDNARGLR